MFGIGRRAMGAVIVLVLTFCRALAEEAMLGNGDPLPVLPDLSWAMSKSDALKHGVLRTFDYKAKTGKIIEWIGRPSHELLGEKYYLFSLFDGKGDGPGLNSVILEKEGDCDARRLEKVNQFLSKKFELKEKHLNAKTQRAMILYHEKGTSAYIMVLNNCDDPALDIVVYRSKP